MNLDNSIRLRQLYESGVRNFAKGDFCGISLSSNSFSYANFQRTNLRQANLSAATLRGIDLTEANLSQSDLRNADLRGACLTHAMLFMASLDGANLQGADLSHSSLDIATLRQANLQGANLCGAYLRGVDLSKVNLRGAYFNDKTQFDPNFDPTRVGMQTQSNIIVHDLLAHLNQLRQCVGRYLGGIMARYWEMSRSDIPDLAAFQVDHKGHVTYSGTSEQIAEMRELIGLQRWTNQFIGRCALLVHDLPDIVDQAGLLVIPTGARCLIAA